MAKLVSDLTAQRLQALLGAAARRGGPRRAGFEGPRFPWGTHWAWGLEVDGTEATIHNAILNVGGAWVYDAGPFTVDCADCDGDWIGYQYTIATGAIALVVQPSLPQPTPGFLRGPLYKVAIIQDAAEADRVVFTVDLAHGLAPTETYRRTAP